MYPIIWRRCVPYLCIAVFVLLKLPDLGVAFYWDESWVYAPAISRMYAHGPSLMPDAIPVEYSRGHPLLFHALCAAWMSLFGASHVAMHSFALCIAVLLAVALYEFMLRLFGGRVALISLMMLLLNHFFFVDSSMVLNDIAVGLCMLLSAYCYTQHRYLVAGMALAVLFFMKESGLVMAVIIAADILITVAMSKQISKDIVARIICLSAPLLLVCLFFFVQKRILGWYLYPGHTSILDLSVGTTLYNLQRSLYFLLHSNSSCYYWSMVALLTLYTAIYRRRMHYLLLIAGMIACYLAAVVFSWKDAFLYVFAALCVIGVVALLWSHLPGCDGRQSKFLKLSVAACVCYLYFSCVNFFEPRYLFPVILMVLCVLVPVACGHLLSQLRPVTWWYFTTILTLGGILTFLVHNDEFTIPDHIAAQQRLVDYMETAGFYEKKIFCAPFLERIHLQDRTTGFLSGDRHFTNVSDILNDSTELMIFDNIEPNAPDSLKHRSDFYLSAVIKEHNTRVEVYRHR